MKKKKVLVIGATGFIGKHLVEALSKKYNVRCLVRKESGKKDIDFLMKNKAEIVKGDIFDKDSLNHAMENIDAVFNLAGGGNVSATFRKGSEELRRLNVSSLENVLNAAVQSHVKRFVHFSSISAMGIIVEEELNENSECSPKTPHEIYKYGSEKICEEFRSDILITIIRPGIVYGPCGMNSEILQLSKLLKKHFFIVPGNGRNTMPWVYVKDVVNAAIISFEKNKKSCDKFIIVSSPQPTFNELIYALRDALGVKSAIIHIPASLFRFAGFVLEKAGNLAGFAPPINSIRARSMTSNRIYSTEKIKNLNYRQETGFEDTIKQTMKWYKENGCI
jgi:nucleoside-diphosphate-sugar epimerase